MKKFYKKLNANRFTIGTMASCVENCTIMSGCVYCGDACGPDVVTGSALIGTPYINGYSGIDYNLLATGNIFG